MVQGEISEFAPAQTPVARQHSRMVKRWKSYSS
jgi:hypothetical protein